MKRAILILITILLNINILTAQNTITGTLGDSLNNERLMFVNVGLLRTADTVFVSGAASDDKGFFKLEHVPNGEYLLQITAIGYENYKRILEVNEDIYLGIIKMNQGAMRLDEVVITEKKPLFANEGEKTLYNVSEDTSIQTGTASDALQNAPGVEVDVEGNITLRGVSSVEIWINGKPSHLNEENLKTYIQQLPANAIKTIEVITNPSARYASKSDGGIINLVLNSNVQKNQFVSFGLHGSSKPDVSPWVSYVYANEKVSFNLYLNGSYSYNTRSRNGYSYSFKDNDLDPSILDTTTTTRYDGQTNSNTYYGGVYMNLTYNIDTMNNVTVYMSGWPNGHKSDLGEDYYRYDYRSSGIEHNNYYTSTTSSGVFTSAYGGLEYQHLFNNEGHNLTISLSGGYMGGNNSSTSQKDYYFWDESTQAFNDSIIGFTGYKTKYRYDDMYYDANIDYNLPYIKNGEIGLGMSFTHDPDSYYVIYDTLANKNEYVNDNLRTYDRLGFSNDFNAYMTIQHKFGNFVIKPGIRMEYSDVHCNIDGYMVDHESKQYLN